MLASTYDVVLSTAGIDLSSDDAVTTAIKSGQVRTTLAYSGRVFGTGLHLAPSNGGSMYAIANRRGHWEHAWLAKILGGSEFIVIRVPGRTRPTLLSTRT